jgi:uncharacterized repeat protein (TIGR03809 family)
MSDRQLHPLDNVALKWRELAERRQAHLVDLYRSGRWKYYYSEEQFLFRLREAVEAVRVWTEIAPKSMDVLRREAV